jgi:hypothetical protein
MMKIWTVWMRRLAILSMGSCLQLSGCERILMREIEVLAAPAANPTLIRQSFLVERFGTWLHLFQR